MKHPLRSFSRSELTFSYKMKSKFTYTARNQNDCRGDIRCAHEIILGAFAEHSTLQHI